MNRKRLVLLIAILVPSFGLGQGNSNFNGTWTLIPQMSHDIGLFANLSIEFRQNGSEVNIIQKWGSGREFIDSLDLQVGGVVNNISIGDRVWPANVFMGLSMPVGGTRQFKAMWEKEGRILNLEESYSIRGSQEMSPISTLHTYELSDDNEILTYTVARSSRTTGPPVKYVLKKAGMKEAYVMRLEDNWEIQGKLPTQAFLISLQGLANADGPRLYFIYPPSWDFTYTESVYDFFKNKRYFTFTQLSTAQRRCKPSRTM
jgi:hypothetical protein